ncbi:MAG: hypothetical protein JSU65_08100 [Candidatus Zixiibacteriota bacterium]|nr:MAG: hypothetical protein JSU65_08100 [candidate division Zixibacteria bacterium]
MRLSVLTAMILLLIATSFAGEEECPAAVAARAGFSAFHEFHELIAPVWHKAWPEKDFEAMYAAAPKFAAQVGTIIELKPAITNAVRLESFKTSRALLADYVKQYSEAVSEKNQEKVYSILPELHEAFESAAAQLIPIDYPEIQGLMVTVKIIVDRHIPAENSDGIKGSTETLVFKASALTEESIPKRVGDRKKGLLKELEQIKTLVGRLEEFCAEDNMGEYKAVAVDVKNKLQSIIETYL